MSFYMLFRLSIFIFKFCYHFYWEFVIGVTIPFIARQLCANWLLQLYCSIYSSTHNKPSFLPIFISTKIQRFTAAGLSGAIPRVAITVPSFLAVALLGVSSYFHSLAILFVLRLATWLASCSSVFISPCELLTSRNVCDSVYFCDGPYRVQDLQGVPEGQAL